MRWALIPFILSALCDAVGLNHPRMTSRWRTTPGARPTLPPVSAGALWLVFACRSRPARLAWGTPHDGTEHSIRGASRRVGRHDLAWHGPGARAADGARHPPDPDRAADERAAGLRGVRARCRLLLRAARVGGLPHRRLRAGQVVRRRH